MALLRYGCTAVVDEYFSPTRGNQMNLPIEKNKQGTSTPLQNVDKGSDGIPHINLPSSGDQRVKGKQSFSKLNLTSQETEQRSPCFLVVEKKEGSFARESPFLIEKFLTNYLGTSVMTRKMKDGLLVKCGTEKQARKMLDMKIFHDYEVTVTPHGTLNYSKGVVTCKDLLNCSLTEMTENLKDEGVVDVKRIMTRKEGKLEETASLILTFEGETLPSKIKAGIYVLPVRPYIPAPLRCFRCQKFGHTSARCDKPEICVCGKANHQGTPCEEPVICINCKGEHSARSKNCPIYKEEAAIQKLKVEKKITFSEARRLVRGNSYTTPQASYAHVTRTSPSVPSETIREIVNTIVPQVVNICLAQIYSMNQLPEMPPPTPKQICPLKPAGRKSKEAPTPSTSEKRRRGEEEEEKKKRLLIVILIHKMKTSKWR